MSRKTKFDLDWMTLAFLMASHSTCRRTKVGCVVVTADAMRVLAVGYNGSYRGGPNTCDRETPGDCGCLHAEDNLCVKLDYTDQSEKILYCTHMPCSYCAKRIVNAGIREAIYFHEYRKTEGIEILKAAGVQVSKMEDWHLRLHPDLKPGDLRQLIRAEAVQGVGHFPAGVDLDKEAQDPNPVPYAGPPQDIHS